ncbi:hypothetical protein J6590_069015 [Homalodisca vitripennis]|nr:hypothetical protein J6590_069015 [Homalodisca vitripennis]
MVFLDEGDGSFLIWPRPLELHETTFKTQRIDVNICRMNIFNGPGGHTKSGLGAMRIGLMSESGWSCASHGYRPSCNLLHKIRRLLLSISVRKSFIHILLLLLMK